MANAVKHRSVQTMVEKGTALEPSKDLARPEQELRRTKAEQ